MRPTVQDDPLRVRGLRGTLDTLRGVPPDVQRRSPDRAEGETEEQVRAHQARLSEAEGVWPPHPLHPLRLRGRLLCLQEPEEEIKAVHQETLSHARQPDIRLVVLCPLFLVTNGSAWSTFLTRRKTMPTIRISTEFSDIPHVSEIHPSTACNPNRRATSPVNLSEGGPNIGWLCLIVTPAFRKSIFAVWCGMPVLALDSLKVSPSR
jgi:hypothetical protein